jgi:uncharacterized protein (DUF983 family)
MIEGLRTLLYGLFLICPVCRQGKIFHSLFTINQRCPNCRVVFERDPGEVTGGMAITLVLVSTIGVVGGGLLALLTDLSVVWLLVGFSVFTVLFGLLFYRHARGLWVSVLYLSGSMFEE